jgi:hypothetical protein
VHGEGGQATVEWVALVLAAALVLAGAGALAGSEADRGLGEAVANRISGAAGGVGVAVPSTRAAPQLTRAAPPPVRAAPAPPSPAPRAADAFGGVRGVADAAKHTWIVCLGYERWRHELEHPTEPTKAPPVDALLDIANTCFNPYDYLLEEDD